MRGALFLGLVLIALAASGCSTAVGNYFANRGRDLAECWRLEIGTGGGVGIGGKALGLVDTGLGYGRWLRPMTTGFVWGELRPQPDAYRREGFDGTVGGLIVAGQLQTKAFSAHHRPEYEILGFFLLPAVLSDRSVNDANGARYANIWSPPPELHREWGDPPVWWRKARTHAFDIEAWAFLGVVGVRAGFSPGEFVDFLLGWFGLDIAGDDVPLQPVRDP